MAAERFCGSSRSAASTSSNGACVPSKALVLSQVALSFGIPFALIPLVIFCRNRKLMGTLTNRRITTVAAVGVATVIVCLNVFLLVQTFAGLF